MCSCNKYLDKKPQQNIAVPSSLADLQALLDNQSMNSTSPGYLEFIADNYYLSSSSWASAVNEDRNNYVWANEALTPDFSTWTPSYETIYRSNFVLDFLPKISVNESDYNVYKSIKGSAFFYRAFQFHQLAQLFCKPYTSSADSDLGIVLRLTSAVGDASVRSSVQQTYDQIISDLKMAVELLPEKSLFSTRPNKAAAFGMLARVYLSMRDYTNAGIYANHSLTLNSTLLDYNSLNNSSTSSLPGFINNPEILYLNSEGHLPTYLMNQSNATIDSGLFSSYSSNDLRRSVYFQANGSAFSWRGSYSYDITGISYSIFDGIATDEVLLIRAECNARTGNKDNAMLDLNTLLRKRWKTGAFVDLTAIDQTDALNKIIVERRKELLFRGLRWSDLRRYNLEGANITISRVVNSTIYTLPPNDLRWVLLIPNAEISRSGIQQNPR